MLMFLSSAFFRSSVYEIDPLYANRPFCPISALTLLVGLYVACKKRTRNDLLFVGWDVGQTLHSHSHPVNSYGRCEISGLWSEVVSSRIICSL